MHLLQESDLQLSKPKKAPITDTPCKILQLKKGIASNTEPLRHSVQSLFFKSNTLFVLLTLQININVNLTVAQPLKTLNN